MLLCTSSAAGSGRPATTWRHAASSSSNPRPPASTTPASRSTGSRSGVLGHRVARGARRSFEHADQGASRPRPLQRSTDSAAARTTVRIVPSTGRSTASYAASAARRSPAATSAPDDRVERRERVGEPAQDLGQDHARVAARPHERAVANGLADLLHCGRRPSACDAVSSSARTTDSRVSAMFVPVSPSGTGYTLSALSSSWCERRASR